MKPYSEYTAEELAMERLFIRWVLNPDDPPIQKFWENWMEQHPSMSETVQSARELVGASSEWDTETLSQGETNSLWGRIRNTIEALPEIENLDPTVKAIATNWYFLRWSVGIVATILLAILWCFWEPQVFTHYSGERGMIRSDSTQRVITQDSTHKGGLLRIK
jgi:hypothetical protein